MIARASGVVMSCRVASLSFRTSAFLSTKGSPPDDPLDVRALARLLGRSDGGEFLGQVVRVGFEGSDALR